MGWRASLASAERPHGPDLAPNFAPQVWSYVLEVECVWAEVWVVLSFRAFLPSQRRKSKERKENLPKGIGAAFLGISGEGEAARGVLESGSVALGTNTGRATAPGSQTPRHTWRQGLLKGLLHRH